MKLDQVSFSREQGLRYDFIAANWQDIGITGRFALAHGVIVVSVALALLKPPPHPLGRYALLMAFVATGALLALFGQAYQTGADVYELFLSWALLGFAFVVAGQWSVVSVAWLFVFNVALVLFFGGRPAGGWLWAVFSPFKGSESLQLFAPAVANLALWLTVSSTISGRVLMSLVEEWRQEEVA